MVITYQYIIIQININYAILAETHYSVDMLCNLLNPFLTRSNVLSRALAVMQTAWHHKNIWTQI